MDSNLLEIAANMNAQATTLLSKNCVLQHYSACLLSLSFSGFYSGCYPRRDGVPWHTAGTAKGQPQSLVPGWKVVSAQPSSHGWMPGSSGLTGGWHLRNLGWEMGEPM